MLMVALFLFGHLYHQGGMGRQTTKVELSVDLTREVGCFVGFSASRGLEMHGDKLVTQCARHCFPSMFFGITYGKHCNCADGVNLQSEVKASDCHITCSGSGQPCGGFYATSVFQFLPEGQDGPGTVATLETKYGNSQVEVVHVMICSEGERLVGLMATVNSVSG